MDELPFLVVHGAIISKLVVIAAAGIAVVAVGGLRRWGDRRRAHREASERASAAVAPREGQVTLLGVWQGGERGWVECGGDRVEIEGAMRVVRGTRARWRWRASSAAHSVHDGDEVLVSGRLVRRSGDEDTAGYREAAGRWVLRTSRALVPIEIVALAPVACPRPLGARGVMLFAGFAVVVYFAGQAVGQRALAHDWSNRSERTLARLDPLDPAVIAAALPGTRTEALEVLADMFDRDILRTRATVEMAIRIARLRGCEPELRELIREGWLDDAVVRARDCAAPRAEVHALLLAGRFDEAAEVANRGDARSDARSDRSSDISGDISGDVSGDVSIDQRTLASIGAGRWIDAAAAVKAQAARAGSDFSTENRQLASHLDCVAELLGSHTGDAAAAQQLRAHPQSLWADACKVSEALLLPIDQQAKALTAARREVPDARLRRTVGLVLWTLRGEPPESEPCEPGAPSEREPCEPSEWRDRFEPALLEPWPGASHLDDRAAWLAPLAADSPRKHAWLAIRQVYAGDWPAAHAEARAVHDRLTGDDWRRFDPQQLDLEIQLREGAPLALDPFGDHAGFRQSMASDYAALRWGTVIDRVAYVFYPYSFGALAPGQQALQAAAHGDGGPLADIVERTSGSWNVGAAAIVSVLPQVRRDRERLQVALRSLSPATTYRMFGYLRSLAVRRDVARGAGDGETASRCQAILDRYAAVLSDRDKLIAFLLVGELEL